MSKNDETLYLIDSCKNDFGILKKWTNLNTLNKEEAITNLVNLLALKIKIWVESDMPKLLEFLYRIDIEEKKVKECFNESYDSKQIAYSIAQVYLERMRQKWNTRQQYSQSHIEGDWDE